MGWKRYFDQIRCGEGCGNSGKTKSCQHESHYQNQYKGQFFHSASITVTKDDNSTAFRRSLNKITSITIIQTREVPNPTSIKAVRYSARKVAAAVSPRTGSTTAL